MYDALAALNLHGISCGDLEFDLEPATVFVAGVNISVLPAATGPTTTTTTTTPSNSRLSTITSSAVS